MTRTDLVESGAGWYVLVWSGEAGLDAWLESNADRVGGFADGCYGEIEWLSEEESAYVLGVTCTTRRSVDAIAWVSSVLYRTGRPTVAASSAVTSTLEKTAFSVTSLLCAQTPMPT